MDALQYGALGLLFVVIVSVAGGMRWLAPHAVEFGKSLLEELRANTKATVEAGAAHREVAQAMRDLQQAQRDSSAVLVQTGKEVIARIDRSDAHADDRTKGAIEVVVAKVLDAAAKRSPSSRKSNP